MAFYIHCDVEFWKSVIEKKNSNCN